MVVKIKTGKIYGLQPPLVAHLHLQFIKTVGVFFVLFFFFFFFGGGGGGGGRRGLGYMVDCLRPFLKIACLQLSI